MIGDELSSANRNLLRYTMKPEKEIPSKKSTIDIEKQHFDQPSSGFEFEYAKNELLLGFKEMVNQGVAKFDFKKNKDGEIESVPITRNLTGERLFHAKNESWTGRADIKRFLGLIDSGQSD